MSPCCRARSVSLLGKLVREVLGEERTGANTAPECGDEQGVQHTYEAHPEASRLLRAEVWCSVDDQGDEEQREPDHQRTIPLGACPPFTQTGNAPEARPPNIGGVEDATTVHAMLLVGHA